MKKMLWLALLVSLAVPLHEARASGWRKDSSALAKANLHMKGRIVDFTANHGGDYRMWSPAMGQKRDLYVYLPPCYDPNMRYPFMIYMHGFGVDEQSFLDIAPLIDEAIQCKKLPPLIIAVPDGSPKGEPSLHAPASFFLNSEAGPFEDFVLQDVWDFVCKRYPIRTERQAHILAGVSMGGFAAYNYGMRHRDTFGTVAGVFPPLNLRWMGDSGSYRDKFDPRHWGWRENIDNPNEVIAGFGLAKVRIGHLIGPVWGVGPEAMAAVASHNPIELIDRTHLRDGQLAMYIAYGGKDEFNIDAQVESFLYLCKFRGITVHVGFDPDGHHDKFTAVRLLPSLFEFLNREIGCYAPVACDACGTCAGGACCEGACSRIRK
ncbi:MAG: alpha/beta hydrolase-fold protein [Gemmataceae bacterium]